MNKKKLTYAELEDLKQALQIPPQSCKSFASVEEVKRAFPLPVPIGASEDVRKSCDLAFDSVGGYDAIYQSLNQHAFDLCRRSSENVQI